MQRYDGYYFIPEDEEPEKPAKEKAGTIKEFLTDESIKKLFDADYLDFKDIKLSNLKGYQEFVIGELYSILMQLESFERKYKEKGIELNLTTVKRAIAADIKAIATASRGRGGFERKLWVTQISKEETVEEKKRPLSRIFGGRKE